MSHDSKDAFTRISAPEDRQRIAQDLVKLKGEIICKAQASEEVFRLEAHRLDGQGLVICKHRDGASLPVPLPVGIVLSFMVGNDKYFANSPLRELGGGYLEVDLSKDIFHLQRRQSYRIRVPESYSSSLAVTVLNGAPSTLAGAIYDLSSGGVRMLLRHDQPVLKMNDAVKGMLTVGDRPAFNFEGHVRHIKVESKPNPHQIVGVEFAQVTPAMEARLFAITMELHRELFARWI